MLLLVACAAVASRTQLRTDMAAFLPRSASLAQQVLTEQATRGAASHLILLAIEGAPPRTLALLSEATAERLRRHAAFVEVLNGDARTFGGVRNFFWRNRYLLSAGGTADRFTVAGLHAALVDDLGLLGSDLGMLIQQTLPNDPTGEMWTLLRQFGGAMGPRSRDGAWVSPDGDRALLLIHTLAAGFDIDAQQHALAVIGSAFARARRAVPGS
ncbi:MAG TPA: hypothetical protein VMF86_13380, partial [Stellaceae bacterium]|nr:hypothetical protein [Stellaceae bacterium]